MSPDHAPTEAQKEAGNYRKEHIRLHGLDIAIENKKGSMRSGVDSNGKRWSCVLPADYGYIKRTEGADGDHVDCYIGPDRFSQQVFIINQNDHKTGRFDEHKVMIGYNSEKAAVEDYCRAFSDGKGKDRVGSIEPVSMHAFKEWLKAGKTKHIARGSRIVEHALRLTANMSGR